MPEQGEMMDWRGCQVVDQDGDKVGKLDEIYLDRETGKPEWAIVNTGLFGRKSSFVPLKDALREEDMIRVPYQAEQIKAAPSVDPDGEISPEEEREVYAHYGLEYSKAQSESGLPEGGGNATGSAGSAGTTEAGVGTTQTGVGTTEAGVGTAGTAGTADAPGTAGTAGTADAPGSGQAESPGSAATAGGGQAGSPGTGGTETTTGAPGTSGTEATPGTAATGETGSAGTAGTTGAGDATTSTSTGAGGASGMRLQRMIREDVRVAGDTGEVVERRTVEEERLTSDDADES